MGAGSSGGTGSLATGGIFGGGTGNFGPTGAGHPTLDAAIPYSAANKSAYFGAITDPDAIAAFMQGATDGGTFQSGTDFLGRKYDK